MLNHILEFMAEYPNKSSLQWYKPHANLLLQKIKGIKLANLDMRFVDGL